MSAELHQGDCVEVMAGMEAGSVDAIVTDPPYGLEFMGKEWDRLGDVGKGAAGFAPGMPAVKGVRGAVKALPQYNANGNVRCRRCGKWKWGHKDGDSGGGGKGCQCDVPDFPDVKAIQAATMQDWHAAWAAEALRVLKPSHYLLAFGGTRTWHRLACALEDAGFEIRDTLMWEYATGFPKGRACLKPAWEPIILARKPGPMRELGIEECRVGTEPRSTGTVNPHAESGVHGTFGADHRTDRQQRYDANKPSGRWPANLVLDEEAGRLLDQQTGDLTRWFNKPRHGSGKTGREPFGEHSGDGAAPVLDSGGASRFFFCAKASRAEREAGLDGFEPRVKDADYRQPTGNDMVDRIHGCGTKARNHHPTVKPLALMRWLVKLVAQPGELVLDPFTGSGSTGVACATEGREFIGIEREAEYIAIARARIAYAAAQQRLPV